MLNQDCLMLIFEKLSILERMGCEKVCQRWKETLVDFCYGEYVMLCMLNDRIKVNKMPIILKNQRNYEKLVNLFYLILQRTNNSLRILCIDFYHLDKNTGFLETLLSYNFELLNSIAIRNAELDVSDILLAKIFQCSAAISFIELIYVNFDCKVFKYLKKPDRLERLHLKECNVSSYECKYLTVDKNNLKILKLRDGDKNYLIDFLKSLNNSKINNVEFFEIAYTGEEEDENMLNELIKFLNHQKYLNQLEMEVVISKFDNEILKTPEDLRKLTIFHNWDIVKTVTPPPIALLRNLTYFKMETYYVDNIFLNIISNYLNKNIIEFHLNYEEFQNANNEEIEINVRGFNYFRNLEILSIRCPQQIADTAKMTEGILFNVTRVANPNNISISKNKCYQDSTIEFLKKNNIRIIDENL